MRFKVGDRVRRGDRLGVVEDVDGRGEDEWPYWVKFQGEDHAHGHYRGWWCAEDELEPYPAPPITEDQVREIVRKELKKQEGDEWVLDEFSQYCQTYRIVRRPEDRYWIGFQVLKPSGEWSTPIRSALAERIVDLKQNLAQERQNKVF